MCLRGAIMCMYPHGARVHKHHTPQTPHRPTAYTAERKHHGKEIDRNSVYTVPEVVGPFGRWLHAGARPFGQVMAKRLMR